MRPARKQDKPAAGRFLRETEDTGGHELADTAVQAIAVTGKTPTMLMQHRCLPAAGRSQNRPGDGSASGPVDLRHTGEGSRRGGGLAAGIFVFWSRPTGIVVLVIAIVLLAALGLIELTRRPSPAQPATRPGTETARRLLSPLRASLRLWLGSLPVWLGAEGGELAQPRPFQGRLGGGNAGPLPGHDHP
jgi:hypothetical protein